jgi:hypothetical protein
MKKTFPLTAQAARGKFFNKNCLTKITNQKIKDLLQNSKQCISPTQQPTPSKHFLNPKKWAWSGRCGRKRETIAWCTI